MRGGAREGGHLPNPTGIGGSFTPLDPHIMKLVLFEMAEAARVDLWLHTILVDTVAEQSRLAGVRVHKKSGFHELRSKVLIDATGDADVAVRAGAAYRQNVLEAALNATLLFRVAGVDTDSFIADARSAPQKIVLLADP